MATLSVDGKFAGASGNAPASGFAHNPGSVTTDTDFKATHDPGQPLALPDSDCEAPATRDADYSGMPRHLVYVMDSLGEDFTDGSSAGLGTTYRSPDARCARRRSTMDGGHAGRGGHSASGRPTEGNIESRYSVTGGDDFEGDGTELLRRVGSPRDSLSAGAGRGILLGAQAGNKTLGAALNSAFGGSAGGGGAAGVPHSLNTNVMALNAYRNMNNAHQILNDSLLKLTSGNRINTARDDAAGLALAENMRSQMLGSKQAVRNAQDGISLVQTAEGVLNTVHLMLQRMRVLAVAGASDSNLDQRGNIVTEMDSIRLEIGRIGEITEVFGRKILGGKYTVPADALRFQIGANGTDMETIAVTFVDVVDIARSQLGQIPQDASHEAFQGAIRNIDGQIKVVSTARSTLGAVMNRFVNTINNLNVTVENLASARSRINDAEFTTESSQYMRGQILTQSSHAMLSQAMLAPRGVLSLLSVA